MLLFISGMLSIMVAMIILSVANVSMASPEVEMSSQCADCERKQTIQGGDYMQVGETGFHSPTDNSQDPPGTITLPLPCTTYNHPKPGENPGETEMELPTFNIPGSMGR